MLFACSISSHVRFSAPGHARPGAGPTRAGAVLDADTWEEVATFAGKWEPVVFGGNIDQVGAGRAVHAPLCRRPEQRRGQRESQGSREKFNAVLAKIRAAAAPPEDADRLPPAATLRIG